MTDFPVIMPAVPEIVLVCAGLALLMVGVFQRAMPPGLSPSWRW